MSSSRAGSFCSQPNIFLAVPEELHFQLKEKCSSLLELVLLLIERFQQQRYCEVRNFRHHQLCVDNMLTIWWGGDQRVWRYFFKTVTCWASSRSAAGSFICSGVNCNRWNLLNAVGGAFVVEMINSPVESTFVSTCWFLMAEKLGTLEMRSQIARAIFDFEDGTPVPGLRLFFFFIFLSLLILLVKSFTWIFLKSLDFFPPPIFCLSWARGDQHTPSVRFVVHVRCRILECHYWVPWPPVSPVLWCLASLG